MYYSEDAYREVFPEETVTVKPATVNDPKSMLPDDPEPEKETKKEDELTVQPPETTPEEDDNELGADNSAG